MAELFADIPSAIENTYQIAKRCNVTLQLGKYSCLTTLFLKAIPLTPTLHIYPKKV